MKLKKKKAFTLTELLVVVVVIGVLSAVTLPKFSKVMETRKTTEAEDLMSAVRTEQEKRCSLDKPYLADINELKDILPTQATKNYDYSLTSDGLGILASSKGKYNYTLSMPSYKDGRLCCEGAECSKLNKDYPLCDDLRGSADFATGSECSAGIVPSTTTCPEADKPTATTRNCESGCGIQTAEVSCVNGSWTVNWSGECKPQPDPETAACGSCYRNSSALKKKAYSCKNGTWTKASSWDMSACGSYICGGGGGGSGSGSSGNAQATQFIVFSDDGQAYLQKDSALCGYACGAQPKRGTKITEYCSSKKQADTVCARGAVGCISGSMPSFGNTQCQYTSYYTCHPRQYMDCTFTSGWMFPSEEPSGEICSARASVTIECPGPLTNNFGGYARVTSSCSQSGAEADFTHECYGGTTNTCTAIYSSLVDGYICSDSYKGTYSGCSSSSSGCGTGCGSGAEMCGLGSSFNCGTSDTPQCGACGVVW